MKKSVKRLIALILAVVVLASVAVIAVSAADSDPTVIFDAAKREFTFENVTYHEYEDGTYPDLFRDIKNAMPGDSFLQSINVKVTNASDVYVKLYLRAENPNADYETLMDDTGVTLSAAFKNGSTIKSIPTLLRSLVTPPELTVYSSENVYLGMFSGSSVTRNIDVTFAIPLEAGNEMSDLVATVDWVFLAEIIPQADDSGHDAKLNTVDHFAYIIGREEDLVRPEAPITRAEVATIFFRLLTDETREKYWGKTNPYSDVPSTDWYNAAISTLTNAGILFGYPDGSFRPNASITRAEFTAVVSRFFEFKRSSEDAFSDIAHHWARDVINAAAAVGLVYGYPDGSFGPDKLISRAEAITIVNRALGRTPHKDQLLDEMFKWPDNLNTDAWYYAQIQEASNSHHYVLAEDGTEIWTELLPIRDWEAFEKMWSDAYSADNPGEVVSSAVGAVTVENKK